MAEPIFLIMIFVMVLALIWGLIVPVFGENKQARKRLKSRLDKIATQSEQANAVYLLRESYLRKLSPLERLLESLPGMPRLGELIREAGYDNTRAYQLVLMALALVLAVGALVGLLTNNLIISIPAGLAVGLGPFLKLKLDRAKRMDKFEEQLPDALDVMKRALQAGHPFVETLNVVATEMKDPIAGEFKIIFNDLNYGADLRPAMLGLLERVPSITVMALVTAVLIQKETGGNMAEILEKSSRIIRQRFQFQRKVKTLSAEGRLSAWILILLPFVLFVVIAKTTPSYLPILLDSDIGKNLIIAAFVVMLVGITWIRKIIRITV